ncbi:MAG: hypothetical protein C0598_10955 [Marinilabiliales bacterium]|nr:MAG: hypothetical protein C0598_10955 [Marinilabiliales bacterium]
MIKKTIIIFLLVLINFSISAQSENLSISIRSNLSSPWGEYAGNDIDKSCFTLHGVSFGSELTWHINQKIGLVLDFNQTFHPVNTSELGTAMVNEDNLLLDLYIRSEAYSLSTTLLGTNYRIKINEKLSVNPKILIGVMYGKTPYQLFFPEYYLYGPSYFTITSSKAYGLAFKGGANLIYAFNNYVAMDLNFDLTYSKLKFGFYEYSGHVYRIRNILFTNIGVGLILKVF